MVANSENFLFRLHVLCSRATRVFACMVLTLALNAWGEDDTDSYPPQFDNKYPKLELGFRSITWSASSDLNQCGRFCSTSDGAVTRVPSNEAQLYKRDSILDLGQSGPFSFRFSDKHLKMEVNF